jgi:hypothetical protein
LGTFPEGGLEGQGTGANGDEPIAVSRAERVPRDSFDAKPHVADLFADVGGLEGDPRTEVEDTTSEGPVWLPAERSVACLFPL